jgi:hypothetical protein
MLDLRKLLHREPPPENPATEASTHSTDEIAQEYRAIITDQLVRGGVLPDCVEIEVRQAGKMRDGQHMFIGMMRLASWERTSAVRLLVGLPILESRVRRAVHGSWLHELSHFGGLWLHASGQLQDTHALEDLRTLLIDIERRERPESQPPSSRDASVWSLPTDLGHLPHD